MLQCLYQIRLKSIFEEGCHSTLCLEIPCRYRLLRCRSSVCISDNDSGKSFLEIGQVIRETENSHDFGCHSDIKTIFSRHSVRLTAEAVNDHTKLTVIHIHASLPGNLSRIDTELISLLDVVVDHSGKKVICCSDCVEVTCEMQVDVFHRNDLCITAACGAALDAENRSE